MISTASCELHTPMTFAAHSTLQSDMGHSSTHHHCCQRTNHQRNVYLQSNALDQHPHHNYSHGHSTFTQLQNKLRLYVTLLVLCLVCQLQGLAAQTTVSTTQTVEGIAHRCFNDVPGLCGSSFSLKFKYNPEERNCVQYLHSGELCEWQEEISEEVNSFDTLAECQSVCVGE